MTAEGEADAANYNWCNPISISTLPRLHRTTATTANRS